MQNLGLGNWHVLLGLPRDSAALDLGCGFGSLGLGLGKYYHTVVGIDALPSRVEYASLRARQDARTGTHSARASGFELPFRAWIGVTPPNGNGTPYELADVYLDRILIGDQVNLNGGAFDEYRYWDNLAVSTKRIGQ